MLAVNIGLGPQKSFAVGGQLAHLVVDPGRSLGNVTRSLFGGFVEHLGRCINGGLFDPGSSRADARGFRSDVMQLIKALRLGVLRWPGGNFVSNYHWLDGIGPREQRPVRRELAWGGIEPNGFGTDEFLAYCGEIGAEPYICLNMGTGTLREALEWVEYTNEIAQTTLADLRRANGHAEPYRVGWWGLGNEMYGEWQIGQMSAEEYAAEASRWAKALRKLDPSIKLVSCGLNGWSEWDRTVIDALVSQADLHSLHLYTGDEDYWTNVLSPHQAERAIQLTKAMRLFASYQNSASLMQGIAYDEYNVWYRTSDGFLEEHYSFDDALAVATYLNIFVRHCAEVRMANLAQMVNAIAPIVTMHDEVYLQPIFYPFLWHSTAALDEAVAVDNYSSEVILPKDQVGRWGHRIADLAPFKVLDACASVTQDRTKLALCIVNRQPDAPTRTSVVLRDVSFVTPVRVKVMTQADLDMKLTEAETIRGIAPLLTGKIGLFEGIVVSDGQSVELELPAKSFVVIDAELSAS